MEIKYLAGLSTLLVLSIYSTAQLTSDVPIIIDLNNTQGHNSYNAMEFCADENYLIYDSTANMPYKEAIGTKMRFPTCEYNATVEANYSYLNLTPKEEAKLPKFHNITIVDQRCVMSKCRRFISVDLLTAHAVLIWENESFIYP